MTQLRQIAHIPNYGFGVAANQYSDLTHIHKFGAVPSMSQNASGTIWDVNDTNYPWNVWDSAGNLSIPAVNASDNGIALTIEGLDSNFQPQSETVLLSSAGTVLTTKIFIRAFRAYTAATNTADILITKDGTTICKVSAGKAQTLMAIYTVPANYTAYLLQGTASCQSGADATGFMYMRFDGQSSFRVGHSFEVSGVGGQYMYPFQIPVALPPKTDIDIRATVRSNNARVTAAFDLLLHDTWQADNR